MGGPADIRLHSDLPDRMFTVDEANALIPALEEIFLRLDPKLARLRELRELTDDYEAYSGGGIGEALMVDGDTYALYVRERSHLDRSIQPDIDEVLAFVSELTDL